MHENENENLVGIYKQSPIIILKKLFKYESVYNMCQIL